MLHFLNYFSSFIFRLDWKWHQPQFAWDGRHSGYRALVVYASLPGWHFDTFRKPWGAYQARDTSGSYCKILSSLWYWRSTKSSSIRIATWVMSLTLDSWQYRNKTLARLATWSSQWVLDYDCSWPFVTSCTFRTNFVRLAASFNRKLPEYQSTHIAKLPKTNDSPYKRCKWNWSSLQPRSNCFQRTHTCWKPTSLIVQLAAFFYYYRQKHQKSWLVIGQDPTLRWIMLWTPHTKIFARRLWSDYCCGAIWKGLNSKYKPILTCSSEFWTFQVSQVRLHTG